MFKLPKHKFQQSIVSQLGKATSRNKISTTNIMMSTALKLAHTDSMATRR